MSDHSSRSEELLSAGLQELARSSPQSASAESKAALSHAFRRHHARRRAVRVVAMLAAVLVVTGASLWLRTIVRESVHTRQVSPTSVVAQQITAKGEVFVALPSFAFETPGEELRVVRVEMPVSSLRVLGARVNDELSTRRIVADLLVGTDGTPYAFRIIS
jgi:hypothetical protein